MNETFLHGPPDTDDSDDSCYDGFYFADSIKRERPTIYVAKDQKLVDALKEGNLENLCEQIDALKFGVDNPVCGGHTMLMHACLSGHYEIAEHLVNERGANVNKQIDSVMPLMLACDCESNDPYIVEKLVRLLLTKGAVINVSDKYGTTPFMFACSKGFVNVVRLLINDVSFDAVNNQGCSPIFFAIEHNHAEVVSLLVKAGVNVNLTNDKGYTPKQVAEFHGFNDLLELLPREPATYMVPFEFLNYNTLRDQVPRIFLKTECPEYFPDVRHILEALDMDRMLEKFAKARISLGEFLHMDDRKLADIGIAVPIYRNKIKKGILDFHLHHWKKTHVARVKKDGMDNFYEILLITANHLQHLVIIQASLRFVIQNQLADKLGEPSDMSLGSLQSNLKAYRSVINDLTKTVKYLHSFSPPKNPLYIDYNEILAERKRRKVRSYFKYTTIILGISVFICIKCKWIF